MLLELVSRSVLFASTWHGMCEFGAVLQWRLFYTPGPDMGRVPVGPVVGSERRAFPGCGSAMLPRFLGATANGQHLLWPLVLRDVKDHAGRSGPATEIDRGVSCNTYLDHASQIQSPCRWAGQGGHLAPI